VTLAPGDLVFLYTDGLTETRNGDDEEFGTERVEALLHALHDQPVGTLIRRMSEELQSFCGRPVADDDITLIALRIRDAENEVSGAMAEAAVAAGPGG